MPENSTPSMEETPQTFTQEQVNEIVQKRVARYADYNDLKAKADQYDELVASQQSDVERLTARAEKAETELKAYKARAERADMVKAVSEKTGVDIKFVSMLSGATLEELTDQANALKPNFSSPVTSDTGNNTDNGEPDGAYARAAKSLFGR